MDNHSSHKIAALRAATRGVSTYLLFLSPYNPELNLIEQAFAKFMYFLRKDQPRTRYDI